MWPGPYGEWGSRKYLLASLDQSLRRMGLDYVDIFYSHRFDPETPLEETMGALDHAVRPGKALYAGISSYSAEQTAEAAAILRSLGTPCLIHQPSLLDAQSLGRGAGCSTRWRARGHRLHRLLAAGPGHAHRQVSATASRRTRASPAAVRCRPSLLTEENLAAIRGLDAIARGAARAWRRWRWPGCCSDPRVTSVLIGASSVAQIEQCVGALASPAFTGDELAEIDRHTVGTGIDLWARSRGG